MVSVTALNRFNDSKLSYQSKSFIDLIRARLVFSVCQIQLFTKNAEILLTASNRIFGKSVTSFILSKTFFGHFCAGEDEQSIKPTVKYLEMNGIGSILDYAAESDVPETINDKYSPIINPSIKPSNFEKEVKCRVYDYKNETMCDEHEKIFKKCITAVKNVSPTGFAAIKCTALGNPELLKRASTAIVELRKLFLKMDKTNSGYVTKSDFMEVFDTKIEGKDVFKYFAALDLDKDDKVDYVEWTNGLSMEHLGDLTTHCTVKGPLFNATLDEEEIVLWNNMKKRIDYLANLAQSLGVRLMIDAEHTYFQPAIDSITIGLAKKYNRVNEFPVIFSTYQLYLKDSKGRLYTDLNRAKRGNYFFAAKLVRGAYMKLEREYAIEHGLEDPIHVSQAATHENYNSVMKDLIEKIALKDSPIEIMIATHNSESIEIAIETMKQCGLPPSSGVYFGQLLGMSDNITFTLGNLGYKAYKYVPYGTVHEVMPYLIRRAQENSTMLSNAVHEIQMLNKEILRRFSELLSASPSVIKQTQKNL